MKATQAIWVGAFGILVLFGFFGAASPVSASDSVRSPAFQYNPRAFEQAKSEGKTVVLDFHADWCPTCRRQIESLSAVLKRKDFAKVVAFIVNYDDEAKLKKELHVSSQSTLILYQGTKELGRSVGKSDDAELSDFLRLAKAE